MSSGAINSGMHASNRAKPEFIILKPEYSEVSSNLFYPQNESKEKFKRLAPYFESLNQNQIISIGRLTLDKRITNPQKLCRKLIKHLYMYSEREVNNIINLYGYIAFNSIFVSENPKEYFGQVLKMEESQKQRFLRCFDNFKLLSDKEVDTLVNRFNLKTLYADRRPHPLELMKDLIVKGTVAPPAPKKQVDEEPSLSAPLISQPKLDKNSFTQFIKKPKTDNSETNFIKSLIETPSIWEEDQTPKEPEEIQFAILEKISELKDIADPDKRGESLRNLYSAIAHYIPKNIVTDLTFQADKQTQAALKLTLEKVKEERENQLETLLEYAHKLNNTAEIEEDDRREDISQGLFEKLRTLISSNNIPDFAEKLNPEARSMLLYFHAVSLVQRAPKEAYALVPRLLGYEKSKLLSQFIEAKATKQIEQLSSHILKEKEEKETWTCPLEFQDQTNELEEVALRILKEPAPSVNPEEAASKIQNDEWEKWVDYFDLLNEDQILSMGRLLLNKEISDPEKLCKELVKHHKLKDEKQIRVLLHVYGLKVAFPIHPSESAKHIIAEMIELSAVQKNSFLNQFDTSLELNDQEVDRLCDKCDLRNLYKKRRPHPIELLKDIIEKLSRKTPVQEGETSFSGDNKPGSDDFYAKKRITVIHSGTPKTPWKCPPELQDNDTEFGQIARRILKEEHEHRNNLKNLSDLDISYRQVIVKPILCKMLNIPLTSDEATLKSIYKKLIMHLHPDRNNNSFAEVTFKALQNLYDLYFKEAPSVEKEEVNDIDQPD